MQKQLFFLLSLLFFSTITSQEKNYQLDSLLQKLETTQQKDTLRINNLLALSNYHFLKDIEKSEPYIKEAISISKSLNDSLRTSSLKTELARIYVTRGLFKEALTHSLEAVAILDSINANPKQKIQAQNILSTVYRGYGNNEKSLETALKVVELSKQLPLDKKTVRYYYNLGQTYTQLKDFKNAEKSTLKALEIAKQIKNKHLEMIMTSVLGDYYKNVGEYDKAIIILKSSIPYYKSKKQDRNLASSYRILGESESLKGNYNEAIPYYEKALEIFDRTGNLHYAKITNQNLYIAYSIVNKREKASLAQQRYEVLKDSLESKERKTLIADMQTKYDTEKIKSEKDLAEKQLQISTLESSKNRNLFIGSSIIAALILLSSLIYYSRLKAKKQAEIITLELKETQKRLALEKQYKDSELKALKAQMNPHFIFNALNSIQDYIVLNQKNLASDYLGKFADLIRNYLHFSDTGFISIPEEVHNLKLYLELEKLRFEDALDYQVTVDDKANSEVIKIPTMLVQPYVENALKHGLLHKKDNRELSISISKPSENIIQCIVEDNGIGREKSKAINQKRQHQHKSFALKATTERLDLLNYGKEQKIGVEILDLKQGDEATGTKVIFNIPIVNK